MPTLDELIEDRSKYPDDMKVALTDGVESTIGDLRGRTMLRADHTRKTQDLAQQRRQFEQERVQAELKLKEAQDSLAQMLQQSLQRGGQRDPQVPDSVDEIVRTDPVARRFDENIRRATELADAAAKRAEAAEARARALEEQRVRDQHIMALEYVKKHDPQVDEGELIRFAQSRGIPRLDDAYRLHSEERRIAKAVKDAKEEGEKLGRERAKQELQQPLLAPRRFSGEAPEGAPASFDDAFKMAARDPEIQAIVRGEA